MSTLIVTDRDGVQATLDYRPELSVMETIRASGFGNIMAICGGCCACATCHVYVDSGAFVLPLISEDEDDLLSNLDGRREASRLACQLKSLPSFGDLRITIAPEE